MLIDNQKTDKQDELKADLENQEILDSSKIDIDKVTLKITKVAEISESEIQKLFEIFNEFRFVILECEPLLELKENLLALTNFFGSIQTYKRSEENGIVSVENLIPKGINNGFMSANNKEHIMHTDGAYEIEPPKIVALQCEIASNNGGLSKIVCAESVYEYLRKNYWQDLDNLFTYPLTITRVGQPTVKRAIFVEKEGRIQMNFRTFVADSAVSLIIPSQIENGYNIIKNYVDDDKNQLRFKLKAHQILILDNTGALHGRTAFPDHEFRKLNKLWFDGKSEYLHYIPTGFIPKSKL